jgi:protocatechuate 3,4-dioxygenase beta subunit
MLASHKTLPMANDIKGDGLKENLQTKFYLPEKPPFLFIKAICMPVTKHSERQAISKAMV